MLSRCYVAACSFSKHDLSLTALTHADGRRTMRGDMACARDAQGGEQGSTKQRFHALTSKQGSPRPACGKQLPREQYSVCSQSESVLLSQQRPCQRLADVKRLDIKCMCLCTAESVRTLADKPVTRSIGILRIAGDNILGRWRQSMQKGKPKAVLQCVVEHSLSWERTPV